MTWECCFGETWTRPGLERKTRSLIALAALAAAGITPLDAPLLDLVCRRFDAARDTPGHARDHTEAIKAWDANSVA